MRLHDLYVAGLRASGYAVDLNARTSKYTVMAHPERKERIFVGKNGGLRKGRTVSESYGMSDATRKTLAKLGEKQIDKEILED